MLRHAKAKPGGRLTFADIRAIIDGFRNEPDAEVRRFYAEAWAECEAAVETVRWDKERKFPLERLIVHNFAHLMPERDRPPAPGRQLSRRSEEHTSELQSLMRTSYAVFCLKKKN